MRSALTLLEMPADAMEYLAVLGVASGLVDDDPVY
jgi:hypothetical protein